MNKTTKHNCPKELSRLSGVPQENIEVAQKKISNFLNCGYTKKLKTAGPCNLKNSGVLKVAKTKKSSLQITAFIPAAGAASRFFKPLAKLTQAIEKNSYADFILAWKESKKFPLPASIQTLELRDNFTQESLRLAALLDLQKPKALMPCRQGTTFLEEKDKELSAYGFIEKKCFVTPPGRQKEYTALISADANYDLLEQGKTLSTIRFNQSGEAIFSEGSPSVTPAGHGALYALFKDLKSKGHEHLFIQNLDNLTGSSSKVCDSLQGLSRFYTHFLEELKGIRLSLALESNEGLIKAEKTADSLLNWLKIDPDAYVNALEYLFQNVLHRPKTISLKEAAADPLQVLGMVPNADGFVGGIPFFWESSVGKAKVCLEGPHIPAEAKEMLQNNDSFFNPVTVFSELSNDTERFEKTASDFWFVADKTFAGQRAFYVETALYELLSDSRYHNVAFVELPEYVFRPHKTLADCQGTV